MVFLTLDQILDAEDLATEEVEVPEWSGKVLCRELSALDAEELAVMWTRWQKEHPEMRGFPPAFRAEICARGIVHPETHEPLFKKDQIEKLARKNGAALDRIYPIIQRLSGMGEKKEEEKAESPN